MINKTSLEEISKSREILIREEDFAYVLPCVQLRSFISNFTITFPNESIISDAYTIMPHGSVTLVLFKYKAETYSHLFGPTTKPIKVGNLANKCDTIFIVEFQPAGFSTFVDVFQKELTNKIIPFSYIDYEFDNNLRNIFNNAQSIDEVLLTFEKVFAQKIQHRYPNELIVAMEIIIQREGTITSKDISSTVSYSSRHLNRMFNQYLGMSTKSFSRLVRINKSIQLLNEEKNTVICAKLGYYDISHFIKDFKMVCHITPQEYRLNMSDFYSEIVKC